MRTSTKLFFTSSILLTVVMLLSALPSFGQTISGTVFRDFNSNGVYTPITTLTSSYTYGEPGVGGVTVTAYNAAGAAVATTTSSTATSNLGAYTLTVGNTSAYRVEFTSLGVGDYESFRGTAAGNNATSVQFVNGGTTNVNFGINYPLDYCQASPSLVVPCYINGNPLSATGTAGNEHVLVTVPYNSSGTAVTATAIADGQDIGSVWGVAYQRETQKIFSAAFLKRHVGLGPAGLGGIYTTTLTGTSTLLVDLETSPFNINLGDSQLGSRSTLPGSATTSSTDPTAFSLVGKAGLGGMTLSTDGKILYVVDLFNRNLLALNVGNPAVTAITTLSSLTTIAISNPGCANGDYRPFAVSVKNNKVYVGIVCSGQSGTVTSGTTSDLYAHVQSMAEGATTLSATPIFSFRLNYTKGDVRSGDAAVGSTWQPWINSFNQLGISGALAAAGYRVGRPQPMLSDITFADNGDMILDFADRTGFQTGYKQRSTTDPTSTTLYGGYIGGDMLRANYNGTQWVLENNATVGALTSAGAGNLQGPGSLTTSGYNAPSGEFYYQESYSDPASGTAVHQETSMGSGFSIPGYNVVINTIMDPTDIFTGGLGWFNNRTGARTQSAELYNTVDNGGETAGKANGLGGIKALCNPAPIAIGNRVWLDTDNDGIQDPGETPLAGVTVTLTGTGIGTVTLVTNSNGEYYFANGAGTNTTGFVYNLTGLTYGGSYTLTFPTSVTTSNAYLSTKLNTATGANADNIDSDVNSAGRITFTLGTAGQNNFSYDAAYAPCVLPSVTALASSASVCLGTSATLTAQVSPTGSYTYAWSAPAGVTLTGANTATAVATGLTTAGTRTFTVTVSSSPICSTTATVTVTVNPLPTPTLTSATICAGQTATLTATGGTSYTFSTGATNTTGVLSITPTTTTTYSVTAVNANGCRSTTPGSGTVTVNALPTANLTPSSATICAGQTATLTATGGTSYTFSNGAVNTSGVLSVTPGATTTYSVTVANASGCVSTTTTTVTVNAVPTPVFPSGTICAGTSATLIATGGTSYTFSTGTINTNGRFVVAPTTTTSYSVVVANANGCIGTATNTVTVNPAVTATLGSATICAGQTATLTATGGTSYTFSNGTVNTTGVLSVTPGATTSYSVTVTNANGCIGTATGTVTVNPAVVATLSSPTICAGTSATLTATGGTSYTFSNGTINTTGVLSVTPGATTTYSVTVSNGNCIGTATGTVTVNPAVTATFPSGTICAGTSATLIATGGTSYTFSTGTINTNGRFVVAPTTTTSYSVVVANANGCIGTATNTVTVNPAVTATITSATICSGQTANLVATGGTSYTFSDGTINTSGLLAVNPTTTTAYSVIVSNGNCIGTATGAVTVNPSVAATLSSATICAGTSATLTATGGTSYTFSNGTVNTTGVLSVTPGATTTYSVTVSNGNCIGTATGTVTVNPAVTATFPSGTICAGTSATLIATGGTAYTFSTGLTNANGRFVVAPTTNTTYSVTVVNASGCRATANATVTVNPAVTATITSATICSGQTANLVATGGTSYTFSDGTINTSGLLAVNPTTTTAYSVIVSNGNCIGTATGAVTVNPSVVATLSSATICAGQSATLTASGGTSYTLSNGLTSTSGIFVVNPGATTTYSVTASNGNCIGTASGTVTVAPSITATLSNATICVGQTANLVATGGNSYTFSNGSINNTGNLSISPGATTTYSVTVTISNGVCTGAASGTVTVNPLPTPALSSATICAGQTANLVATGGTSYTFSDGTTNTTGLIAVNPNTTTTYSVTVANASGCRSTTTATVTVNTIPTASLTPASSTICAGTSVTLTATGGTNYQFSNGTANTTGVLVVTPTANGSNPYSVTVTSGGNCSAVANATVTVNPAVTATVNNPTVCSGTSATLVVTGGSTYRFNIGSGITNTTGLYVVNPVSTTAYSVTVTSAQGCSAVTSVAVTVNPATTATISGNTTICAGQPISLTASPTTGLTYAWSGPGISSVNSNPLTIANSTTANSGTYQVVVTNANGCTAVSSINVTVKSAPQVQIVSNTLNCTGGGTTEATISAQVTGGTAPLSYAWYLNGDVVSTSPNPSFTATGTYSLVVTDATGCVSNTASTTVNQADPLVFNAQATNVLCAGGQGSITVNINGGTGSYTVTYANSGGVFGTQITSGTSTTTAPAGSYTITVTDGNGCSLAQSTTITQPAPLIVTLTPSGPICASQTTGSITSSVSGGVSPYNYVWSNGATTPNLINVAGGSYSVIVTGANGCTATASTTIQTNPLPGTPTVAVTQPTCATTTGTITITSPATGVQYSFDNGATYQVSPTSTGLTPAIYRLRARDNVTGCVSAGVNVTINAAPTPPTASIAGTTNLCVGQTISLTASPATGVTYAWTGPGGNLGGANPLVITNATAAQSGTYQVLITDTNTSCTAVASTNVTVNALPTATLGSVSICIGQSANLVATGGTSYTLSTGATNTTGNFTVTPTSTTAYSVTVANANGCTNIASATVTVNSLPTAGLSSATICAGNSATLVASGGTSYTFSNGAINTTGVFIVSPASTTAYSVTVANASGCTNIASATVTVNQNPSSSLSSATICAGQSATLTASGGASYTFSTGEINTTGILSVTPANTTTYSVTASGGTNCISFASGTVTVNPIPNPTVLPSSASICTGGSVVLTASGGTSYTLSNGTTSASGSFTVSPTVSTTYTVTVSNGNGCISTTTVAVTVNPLPNVVFTPTVGTICVGQSTTLVATGANSYTYSNGNINFGGMLIVAPTSTTAYSVTGLSTAGCSATASATIIVNQPPTPALTNATICVGQSATLTASGGTSYSFSTGETNTTGILSVTPANTTTYSVTVANASGCRSTTTGTVTVNQLPTSAFSPSSPSICVGQSVVLTATGGSSFSFSTGETNTTGSITVAPTSTTAYSVTAANGNGCSSTASVTVTVNQLPNVVFTPTVGTICVGQSTTLVATGANSYTYSNGNINFGGMLIVSPTSTTAFSVTGLSTSGCYNSATAIVTVNQPPTPAITSATICVGQSATLTASGGTSYSFSTGETNTTGILSVTPASTTTYSVTVANASGCISTTTGTVTVNQVPTSAFSPSSPSICVGQSVVLTATGGSSFSFSTGETNTTGSITVAPTSTTAYSVTAANGNGCSSTASVTVTVNQLPNVVFTPTVGTICVGQSTTLVATGANSYTYSNGNINFGGMLIVSPTSTTAFSVTGLSTSGCYNSATAIVTVNQPPTPALTSATICVGQSATLTASGGTSYSFSTGETNTTGILSVTPATTTTYSVTVANASGCISTTTGTVTVNQVPTSAFSPSSPSICVGQSVVLTATGGSSFSFSTGETNTTGSITVAPTSTTAYSVTAANGSGCISTTTVTVTVSDPPTPSITSATLCVGQMAMIVASGGTSYTFSTGEVNTTGVLAVSPTATTTYTVTVANATGCVSTTSTTVTVNDLPNANVSASSGTICAGQSTTLTATGGTSYTFSTGDVNTTGILAVSPTSTTAYSVTVANANGCISSTSAIITVNPSATATLSSVTICAGETTELIADGGTSYTFSTGEINTTGRLQVSPTTNTTYSVTAVNASGCVSNTGATAASGTVTVNSVPVADVTATSTTICEGQSVTLTATGGTSYEFSDGTLTPTGIAVVSPLQTTTYVVAVSNDSGCESLTTIVVTVNPLPTADITSATICEGQSATLVATGGTSYTFSNGEINTTGLLAVSPTTSTTYTVTVASASGCVSTTTGTVTVNTVPIAGLTPASAIICEGQPVTLTATGGTSYTFSNGTSNATGILVVSPTSTTAYSVTVANGVGCASTASVTVTVNPTPDATLTSATICEGQSATLTASGGTSYSFSTGETNTTGILSVTPANTTTYSVTVASASGCVSTTTATVTVNDLPTLTLTSETICAGLTTTLRATPGFATYIFSTGLTQIGTSNEASGSATGTYSVTAITAAGCSATATGSILINNNPVVQLSSATICTGQSATLIATSGYTTYIFSPGLAHVGNSNVAIGTVAGTYSVTAIAAGCSGIGTGSITIEPYPVADLTSASICAGQSATLVATGGVLYTFSDGTINTTGLLEVTPATTTMYSVTVANAAGCTSTTMGSVTVNPLPTIDLASVTICAGQSATLTASGGTSYVFSNGISNATGVLIVSPTSTTAYSVTVATASGCVSNTTATVTVNELPVATLTSATICLYESATLVATGGVSYTFSDGTANLTGLLVAGPASTTTYSVTVANASGCISTTTATLTVNPLPTLTTVASCSGIATYNVSFTATPGATVTASAGTVVGNQVIGIPSGQMAMITVTLNGCSITEAVSQNCESNAASLGNFVWNDLDQDGIQDDGEPGLVEVTVVLLQNGVVVATTSTDANGMYRFNGLTPGIPYSVSFTTPAGFTATLQHQHIDGNDDLDSDADPITGLTPSVTLAAGEFNLSLDAGFYVPRASLGDFVWNDLNQNGIQDSGEPGIAGVVVTLYQNGTALVSTTTNASGLYSFTGLTPGIPYSLSFSTPLNYTATLASQGGNINLDSDPVAGVTGPITLTAGENNTSIDAGFYLLTASLGNFVFEDVNHNGIQDTGEPGIQGVVVTLVSNGTTVASTTTDVNGIYSFTGLTPGVPYSVSFAAPTGYSATLADQGADDALDSDGDPATGLTGTYSLTANEENLTVDMGYYRPATLNGYVWVDTDRNGQQGAGEPPLGGVIVTLVSNGNVVATAITDVNGLYSFTGLTPGTPYSLSFTTPSGYTATAGNQGGDDTIDSDPIGGLTPSVTLTSGQSLTQDAGFFPVTAGLGNFVFEDLNHNGIQDTGEPGIPGVTVTLISNGTALVASTTTDANGLYSFTGLTPGVPYSVSFTAPTGFTATLINQGADDEADSDGNPATGLTGVYSLTANEFNNSVDMGYFRPATLNGYVWVDTDRNGVRGGGEPPLAGVIVTLIENGTVVASTTTDASGLYSFTGLTPGVPYSLSFTTPTGYTATLPNQGGDDTIDSDPIGGLTPSVTLTSGQSLTQDAGFFQSTATLGDFVFVDTNQNGVQDSGEPGIQGVVVTLISNGTAVASITTDANGLYSFTGLTPGIPYSVSFTAPAGYTATLANQGGNDETDSDPIGGITGPITLTVGENNTSIDAGFYPVTAALGNFVFEDLNRNGIQDSGEPGIQGVIVTLISNGTAVASTTTDVGGFYSFTGLTPGTPYSVSFTAPVGYTATLADQGTDDALDSDGNPATGLTGTYSLTANEANLTVDMGYYRPAVLNGYVWVDIDRNGQQGVGEPPLAGVIVTIISNGSVVATTTTDANGLYSFTGLTPGTPYSVSFTTPAGYTATLADQGGDDGIDSDPIGGLVSFTLGSGQNNVLIDAGFYPVNAALGNLVFEDTNHNGIQDSGEPGIAGVTVTLISNGTAVVASTTTDASGLYSFTGLTPGTPYSLSFSAPTGYSATLANQGTNDEVDSDGDVLTGLTGTYSLTANEVNNSIDMGYYRPATLNGYVWVDTDRNGQQGAGEPPLAGVIVTVISNGTVVATTTTDANGLYSFTGLTPGTPYSLSFTTPAGHTATAADQGGDDTIDSDPIGGLTPSVTLTSGQSLTQDAGFYPVTAGLGDYVFEDLNHNGQQDSGEPGIPGVTVTLISNGTALVASTTTDASGLYSFTGLTPGVPYSVSFTAPAGYTATSQNQGNDATDSDGDPATGLTGVYSLTNNEVNLTVDMGYYRPASVGDFVFVDLNQNGVQDAGEPGLAGVVVTLLDGANTPIASVTTTSTGLYSFSGLTPGVPYSLSFSTPTGYTATLADQGGDDELDSDPIGGLVSFTLTSGQSSTSVDAGYYQLTASLGNLVFEDVNHNGIQDSGEPGIQGVVVTLISNGTAVASTTTDASGLYSFTGLTPGVPYSLSFSAPTGYSATLADQGGNDETDSDGNVLTGLTGTYSLTVNEVNNSIDMGYYRPASLNGYVWIDSDRDGVQDAGESPLQGVVVTLISNGTVVASTTTDVNGLYSFTGLTPGVPYSLSFTTPTNFTATLDNQGGDDTIDSDPIGGLTPSVTLTSGQSLTQDAGYYPVTAGLGNFVFEDLNHNGIQDSGEPGIPGVSVSLIENGVILVATTTTDASGFYSFTGLTPGTPYSLSFSAPAGYTATLTNQGTDDDVDSDGDVLTGLTGTYSLTANEVNNSIDMGYYRPASVGDFVFVDLNQNGVQDAGEPGLAGVVVTLLDGTNTPIASVTTTSTGLYSFSGLTPGVPYSLSFSTPTGYTATLANQGGDDTVDSDPIGGLVSTFTLTSGQSLTTVDAGYYVPTASIGSTVWNDLDRDGQRDPGEPGVDGVTVRLLRETSPGVYTVVSTTVTTGGGHYLFTNLPAGTYIVEFDLTTLPAGYIISPNPNRPGVPTTENSDANPTTGRSAPITLDPANPVNPDVLAIDAALETDCPPAKCVPFIITKTRSGR
ncbi:hypothetical protein GCM10027592_10210 [Spirosoma flavus]